jgi:hypothetical protein
VLRTAAYVALLSWLSVTWKAAFSEAWAGRSAGAVLTRPALLRRSQFRSPQEAAHGLAADGEPILGAKSFRQMEIVEAPVLAAGQAQDQLLLGNRKRPTAWASAIPVLDPADGIGPITVFEARYLTLAQLLAFSITFTRWNSF